MHGVRCICDRGACSGAVCLHLILCMGCVCGTCDKGACSGACLFALGYVHGVRVWHVRQGSVQQCVFVCT